MYFKTLVAKTKWFIFFFSLLFSTQIFSTQNLGPKVDLFRVDKIEIEGLKKVEAQAVKEKLLVAEGIMLDNHLVQADIKRIYEMNYFEFVEAHQLIKGGKKVLKFRVKERPIISAIKIEGNDKVDKSDIESQIKSKQFNILDTAKIKSDVKDILKFYEEKGFYLANVTYQLKKVSEENIELIFKIQEADKVKVKKITFLGNRAIKDNVLKDFMLTKEEDYFSFMSESGSFKDFFFQADVERIKFFYMTKGYLQINIGSPQVTVSEDKRWIFITFQVTEGPQFSINELSFQGELLFPEEELRAAMFSREGQVYSEDFMRKDVTSLTEKYQDKGYAFANVLKSIRRVPGENKVNVQFSFEKGELAYFGRINIVGNTKTRDKVIRRELKIKEGEKYSGSSMRISKANIERLGFFEPGTVEINTSTPKGERDILDVEIRVKERNTGQITLGAGYSSQTGVFFQGSVQQSNFMGKGQILGVNLNLSKSNEQVSLKFTEPYFNDSKWLVGGSLFVTKDNSSEIFESKKKGFSMRAGYPLTENVDLFSTYSLVKSDTDRKDNESTLQINPLYVKSLEDGVSSTIQFAAEREKRNNKFEPSAGTYAFSSVEVAGLGGDKQWFALDLDARYYKRVWGDLVFRSRFFTKKIFKIGGRAIPLSEKVSLGGPKNLRGYRIDGIGPKLEVLSDDGTEIIVYNARGLMSFFTNLEFEHPLAREAGLKWAVFFDAGSVYSKYVGDGSNTRIRMDYGFGLRWFSPIGILRFEFGFPIDKRAYEDSKQFYFDLGQIF